MGTKRLIELERLLCQEFYDVTRILPQEEREEEVELVIAILRKYLTEASKHTHKVDWESYEATWTPDSLRSVN